MDNTLTPNHSKSKFLLTVEKIRQLPPKQLITLALLAAFLPMLVTAALHQFFIDSQAVNDTPQLAFQSDSQLAAESNSFATIETLPPDSVQYQTDNPIVWKTEHTYLQADSFMIESEGEVFVGNTDKFLIHSDPPTSGDQNYTTLEVAWTENDQEMRFYAYFYKDSNTWWTNELRTYDSVNLNPEWIFFAADEVPFFKGNLGQPYSHQGDMILTSADERSKIFFKNIKVEAFTSESESDIVCAADVKICPDGSSVSRDPQNNCIFRPCPPTNLPPADFNQDGLVDLFDYHILVVNYGATGSYYRLRGDINQDEKVDIMDFNLFVNAFK